MILHKYRIHICSYSKTLATLGEMHYQQSIEASCQYLAMIIREYHKASSIFDSHSLGFIQNNSQLVGDQTVVESFQSDNSSGQ